MRSPKQPAKFAMLLLLALLLLCNIVGDVHGKTIHENSVDLHALLDFKKGITNDPQALSNWNTSTHFCRWNGVICTTKPPFRVLSLSLTGLNLQGQITPSLGNLSFLIYLDLSVNNFVGSIPILGNLQNLQTLYLYSNNLNGTIPDSLANCSSLDTLDLSVNSLVGIIPPKLALLSKLSNLNLSVNSLEGQISSSLGKLTFLSYLDLSGNNFVGPLPSLGHLQQLQKIFLSDNQLNGIIPDSLANCSNLTQLDLSINSLVGEIPSEFHLLSNLTYLNLSANSLVGVIPPELGSLSNLVYLDLSINSLVGQIPQILGSLSNLVHLDLSKNSLVGQIPPKLDFLQNLEYINLRLNNLDGRIPDELWKSPKLQSMLLDNNRLSGELPRAILNLPALEYLGLLSNNLGKELPPNIGNLLPNLVGLSLNNNSFEGQIPASLGNALRLEVIDLSNNKFTGRIPASLGNLSNLTRLNLELNQLEAWGDKDWEFFNALTNCHSLKYLILSFNKLHGSIPQSVGNLSTGLEQLLLAENKLSGQVPGSIGKLSALTQLALSGNNFSGEIGGWIHNLKLLQLLNIGSNSFTGSIPASIANFTRLTYLYAQENEFEGLIPARLGNLPHLQDLYLSYNNLQGYIPPNIGNLQGLVHLNLSHNNLQGGIAQISNLKQLSTLDLSSNKLTGEIPDSLGQCYDLVSIQMDQNSLTGNIPVTFGNLSFLGMLNLSHNNLSGTIPSTLNKLQYLDNLDLSYNDLQGEIPINGVFENATAVSLEGNRGLCGGAVDLHMDSCTTISKKAQRRYRLIKVLIPIFGFMSVILLVYFLFLEKKMRRRTHDTSSSLGENFLKVSYADLAQATENFSESNLVGRGGYGSVYRGKLKESKVEVAVKVFDLDMHGAEKSFLKECETLRSIQHRNLLPIITACSTVDNTGNVFKALVYEFMPNGNLDTWLHHTEDGKAHKHLSLAQRLSIAVNMADALDYLHFDCGRPTIHCDLKPSNILLDDDMNALLGDFGIASFYQDSWSTSTGPLSSSSVGVKGTIGYIAPEYGQGGRRASTSGDVYGFGIILLEMMTGKRPTDPMFKDGVTIVDFVASKFPHEIGHIVDANLVEECKDIPEAKKVSENHVQEYLVSVLQLALSCTHPVASERMNMKEIASKIQAINKSYVGRKAQERVN